MDDERRGGKKPESDEGQPTRDIFAHGIPPNARRWLIAARCNAF